MPSNEEIWDQLTYIDVHNTMSKPTCKNETAQLLVIT